MKIMQTITDYVMKSILTTQGDLIVRGAAIPERLAAVASGQVLKSAGVGATPAWGVPSIGNMGMAQGIFTQNAGGDKTISGLSIAPKLIFLFSSDTTQANLNWGFGMDNSSIHAMVRTLMNGTETSVSETQSIHVRRDAGNHLQGVVSSLTSDGFVITFTLSGACSIWVVWFAIG